MSRLLSKLSPLIHKNSRSVRSFSSSATGPCVSICSMIEPSPDGAGNLGEVILFDIASLELVRTDKTYPDELFDGQLVGASHGWGFFSNRHDRSVIISDYLNPYASKSKSKMIHLPFFTPMYSGQTEVVCNVAMSSSPPDQDDQDWVVGIKFLGRQLSLCRPRHDLRWTNILTPFESWDSSKLMYSKKDQRFYLLAPGGNYLCSWDLNFKEDKKPKFHELVLHNLPNMPRSLSKLLDSYCREDHWVESPSGESFLVKWYSEYPPENTINCCKSPIVMVFREEETKDGRKNMRYTEDIGDLCIFISRGEDFCVKATSCPGLDANSICLHGRLFATLNIAKRTVGCYLHPQDTPRRIPYSPYWLPPFSP
ncbi:hypothetical protein CARUB_v10009511mg [Capsella rubella]|uniref:KIB1-4 beta-propeller domain-containing protein n=1 Tax=Capsella rubella TaxID=81985 RepID=R0GQK9_9BRAS|nr:uncharacterized protein LOC17897930 [Capsella rubella]EOA38041.1 hypothetical protein CARUB_v10009511mg [Capsella rubella]